MAAIVQFNKPGKHKCPQCSHTRQHNKSDKPLSVHYDGGQLYYKCHHCNWKGKVESGYQSRPRQVQYRRPQYEPAAGGPGEKLLAWFAARGIPAEVVRRHQIEVRTVRFGDSDEKSIAFPYYRQGEVFNVKYRTLDKEFRMEAGAEVGFYGLDDIDPALVVFVEGELDKLSLEVAGIRSCLSVPNGAGTNLDILAGCEAQLDSIRKCVLAGDNDEPGIKLQNELIRRLGPERCWRVEWPEGCKDANEVLMQYGAAALRDCINSASPMPIEGAFELADILPDLIELYNNGRPQGVYCGWDNLATFYKPRLGQWTVITGTPNSGKSSLCRALLVNLARDHDWQFVVFPPEDCPPAEYWSLLLEIYTGKKFDKDILGDSRVPRMSIEEVMDGSEWIDKHFVILNPPDGQRDYESLMALAKVFILRRGVNGFVIDPWNRVEHSRPPNVTVTQYIEKCLVLFSSLTKLYQLHNIIVAHPAKPTKNKDGQYSIPTLYDISDSAHWHNMSDFGLVVWRDKQDKTAPVQIHVQKVRSRWCGELGMAELGFELATGRYSETGASYEQDKYRDEPEVYSDNNRV